MKILNFFRKNKVSSYQDVKNKIESWDGSLDEIEKKSLLNVKAGIWHERDVYQMLISKSVGDAKLVSDLGRKYIRAGGDNESVLRIIENKGAQLSVSGILKFLDNNGINNTLSIYTLELLAESDNGVNIAKSLYSEVVKRDVKKALSYGLWASLYLDDSSFVEHVSKRMSWLNDSAALNKIFRDVFSISDTVKDDFISVILENLSEDSGERLLRKNFEILDHELLAEALLNNNASGKYIGLIKKTAASVWSKKNYSLASLMYRRLLEIDSQAVFAERYVIACERSDSDIDSGLDFVSDINQGIAHFKQNQMPESEWFENYPAVARKAIDDVVFSGNLSLAIEICKKASFDHNKLLHWQDLLSIKNDGLVIPPKTNEIKPFNSKIAYLLYNSLPVHSGGYATRSHGIISNLMGKGIVPHVMTRLGYPYDLNKFKDREVMIEEEYDGITYHRLLDGPGLNFVPVKEYLASYTNNVKQQLIKSDSSVVHAASNHINGIAAVMAGRELGLKTIFEVRGMWEVTRLSRQPEWEGSDEFEAYRYLETLACLEADVVITITGALKDELIRRGVEADKIHVVSNGVDTDIFKPLDPNLELKASLGIPVNNSVIGYVGSIVDYEGLDILIDSMGLLVSQGRTDATALIIGDGVVLEDLKQQVVDANLSDYFVFTGRIPHEEVPNYYSIIDICPFPRRGLPVCELVSPLKPFEAMAMGKVIIGSSVQAIAEFIEDNVNGFVHEKDNAEDLALQISRSIESDEIREQLKETTRNWVVENRDWKVLANKVFEVYESFK